MNLILSLVFFLTSLPSIEERIPEGAFAYPGQNPREIITLDPSESPHVEKAYQTLKNSLFSNQSEEEIIYSIAKYVSDQVFHSPFCTEKHVWNFIETLHPGQTEPEIPLDTFVGARIGVCRHIALCSTYFVHRLIEEHLLEGEAFLIRENIPCGRHAWTLFLSSKGAWHLDACWRLLENGKTPWGFDRLCRFYGKLTMEKQKIRWEDGY